MSALFVLFIKTNGACLYSVAKCLTKASDSSTVVRVNEQAE